jgi:hypothetical protein
LPKAEIANAVNAAKKAKPQMAATAHGVSGLFGYHLQYTTARLTRHSGLTIGFRPVKLSHPLPQRRVVLHGKDPNRFLAAGHDSTLFYETAAIPRGDPLLHKQFGQLRFRVRRPGSLQSFDRAPIRLARSQIPGNPQYP